MRLHIALLFAVALAASEAHAADVCAPKGPGYSIARSKAVLRAYVNKYPCPSTGKKQVSCPNYRLGHPHSLCAGGTDTVDNIIWERHSEWLENARIEKRYCAKVRRQRAERCKMEQASQ